MKKRLLWIIAVMITVPVYAQTNVTLTPEYLYNGEIKQRTEAPPYFWTSQNTIILYDTRVAWPDRSYQMLDPQSGERFKLFDMRTAIAGLQKHISSVPAALPWPEGLDASGSLALFSFEGDVFIFHFKTSQWTRVTATSEEEMAPRLAPDGKKVVYVRHNDLFSYDLVSQKETQITSDGSSTLLNGRLSWVYWEEIYDREELGSFWSDDGSLLAFYKFDESQVDEVVFQDYKPAVPALIRQRYPKTGSVNPIATLHCTNMNTGKTVAVDMTGLTYEYIVRVKWLPDNKRLAMQTMNRSQTELNLYFVDAASGRPTRILTEINSGFVREHNDLYFLKGGSEFIWSSQRSGYTHLYHYQSNGRLIRPVTSGTWSVQMTTLYSKGGVVGIDEKTQTLYYQSLEKSSIERHIYSIRFDGKNKKRLSIKDGTYDATLSPDGRFLMYHHSSANTPPSLTLHKPDGSIKQVIAAADTTYARTLGFVPYRFFTIATRDSFPMPAMMLRPADFDSTKKYPVILHVYGGPSAPQVNHRWPTETIMPHQLWVRDGYIIITVDNRSATGISKILENTVVRMQASDGELRDLEDAVAWIKTRSFVDPERIGIWGRSGGGTFTLLAMTRTSLFKAGVAVAPLTSWHYYDTKYGEATMKTPQENPDGYLKTDLNRYAKNLSGRLLLVHGTYDDNVHPQNTWHFVDELIRADKRFDMMMYPMRKHTFTDTAAKLHLCKTMIEFWKRNL
ncbi:MAG TPA: S9 family peptidase [bacterium]|nr:S9 family peptidase [bacterium]